MSFDSRTAATGEAAKSRHRDTARPHGRHLEDQPVTVWGAVTRVAEVTQRLIMDRFELARLETREDMAWFSKNLVFVLGALPILLAGWMALMAGVVIALLPVMPVSVSLVIMGAIHVVGGAVGTYIGLSRLQRNDDTNETRGGELDAGSRQDSLPESAGGDKARE